MEIIQSCVIASTSSAVNIDTSRDVMGKQKAIRGYARVKIDDTDEYSNIPLGPGELAAVLDSRRSQCMERRYPPPLTPSIQASCMA